MIKPNVLLVEDNKADITLIRYTLSFNNIEADLNIITDGSKAMNFIESLREKNNADLPDLILLDLNIPSKNGFELLKIIRQASTFGHIPVLVFTSSENENDIYKSYELKANAYIFKKHDLEEFITTLGSALKYWLP